jgi:hypothetical protein
LPFGGIPAERIEARTLVTPPGAADAVILVDLDDLATHPLGDLAQLPLLVGGGLVEGADAKVENGALHRNFSPCLDNRVIAQSVSNISLYLVQQT